MPVPRVLDLPGSCNLRDFGGYATSDGHRVRSGRLYRSGALSRLTPAAVAALHELGVRAVCDLRRTEERRLHPNPSLGVRCRAFEWETATEISPIRDRGFAESPTVETARAAMIEMYEHLPFRLQPRLAGAFAAILHAGEGATLVHCAAGKDRTGVAVALVLSALGVPRESIVADYVYTNSAVDLEALFCSMRTDEDTGPATDASAIRALSPVARRAVLDAHPSYLAATFASIETRHGSVERYLAEELALGPGVLSDLRRALLTG